MFLPFRWARQHDSIALYYHGEPNGAGLGSFVQSSHGSNNAPIIWTLSEPYGAKDWWPCKQDLNDKIDSIDVIITTPKPYIAASNGLLVHIDSTGSNYTYHWKHRYPIAAYLVCMAVSNYKIYYNYVPFGADTLPVQNFVYPEDIANAQLQTPEIVPIMQLYDSLFGLYPFNREKYGMVEFGWGGGMEHQTMTFISGFSFDVVAHELGHHWFGDKVTCASWHDIWLNEGFATYLSILCYEHIKPGLYMPSKQQNIQNATDAPHGSVWCNDTTSVNRIFNEDLSYSKGAMVVHMLRWVLGDSLFYTGMRNYLNSANSAYAFANTHYLMNSLEATSGIDLSQFFTTWVYGKGYPSYQIGWNQDSLNHVTVVASQTQSDSSVSFFSMPLPIQFKNATHDTILVFNHTYSGQTFYAKLPFAADTVIFDPDLWIISAHNTITRNDSLVYNDSVVNVVMQVPAGGFSMALYPNPVENLLQLQIQSFSEKSADIKIFNSLGQMVQKISSPLLTGPNNLQINVTGWQPGAYYLSIQAGGNTIQSSFVVM